MFCDCSDLTEAPTLPATTLVDHCYAYMFQRCAALARIEVSFSSWESNTANAWVSGVAASGTFVKPAALPETFGTANIPTGWTVVYK